MCRDCYLSVFIDCGVQVQQHGRVEISEDSDDGVWRQSMMGTNEDGDMPTWHCVRVSVSDGSDMYETKYSRIRK